MHTLFIGNLPRSVSEEDLRQLFRRSGVDMIGIDVRRGGIAFAHCPDQNSADKAIEILNGYQLSGSPIRVEPSVPRNNRSNKVFVRQLPADIDWDEFETLVTEYGDVINYDRGGADNSPTVIVTYKTFEQAESAAENLNKREFHGQPMKATIYYERSSNMRRNIGNSGGGGGEGRTNRNDQGAERFSQRQANASDLPLRMVVGARFVGAIIGQGGANIRQITKDSKARCVVDVQRGIQDPSGNVEKVINIFGTPENCTKACLKILEVVQREMAKEQPNQGKSDEASAEAELKIRIHNNLVGRLIGKAGSTIKKIMEETGCTIFVSNISELSAFNMERTITIRGSLENIAQAEQKISTKLRQCLESDLANTPSAMYGIHPLLTSPINDPYGFAPSFQSGLMAGASGLHRPGVMTNTSFQHGTPSAGPTGGSSAAGGMNEVVHIWVPNHIVGALIGTKGTHIRGVMRSTGANIRIESSKSEDEGSPQPQGRRDVESERQVTITGIDQQQYRAQFWVYQRVCEQGYHFFDEVRLCTEVQVPSKLVGRIIGKGGQNVRELQRVTGAQVKIPEDNDEESEYSFVHIIGNFNASQAVQARIRQIVQQFYQQQGGGRSHSADRQQRRHNNRAVNHYADDRD